MHGWGLHGGVWARVAAALAEQLAAMPDGSGTSEVRQYGSQENAMWRAVAEAALVSLVLVAACVLVGLMLREVLQGLSLAAGGGTVPSPARRPIPPAPEEPRTRKLRARLETGKAMIASEKKEPDAPVQVQADDAPTAPVADALAPADALAQVQDASVQVQGESAAITPCPDGVRNAIKAGVTSPTLRGVMKHGRGQEFAAAWLAELGAEGVLEPAGRGRWKLAKAKD